MTTTTATTRRAGLLVTLVAILLSFLSASPVSAAVVQNRQGYTGGVYLNGAMVTGRDQMVYNTCCSYVLKRVTAAGFDASRTTAYSGAQRVDAIYLVQRWVNGGWQTIRQSGSYGGTVSGTARLTFPTLTFDLPTYTSQYAYRVVYLVAWANASTGASLGSERVVPNTYSDNVCSTRFTRCTSYTDSVVM